MSVICKMNLSVTPFADGKKINAHAVYDTTIGNTENEDVRFTKATPWGNLELNVPPTFETPETPHWPAYLFFTDHTDQPNFDGCLFALQVRCASILDTGFQKQVELAGAQYLEDTPVPEAARLVAPGKWPVFNLKMGVDNEAASVQFTPQALYWCVAYDADKMTAYEAIEQARAA